MTSPRVHRFRHDDGAAVVEFVILFVFVVLPLVLFGMQLLLNTFVKQQATASARDGARAAVVAYGTADDDGAGQARVEEAVRARLAFAEEAISVRCIRTGTDLAAPTTIPCSTAMPGAAPVGVNSGEYTVDSVEVSVGMRPLRVVGPFGIFLNPLLPASVSSSASMGVVTKE